MHFQHDMRQGMLRSAVDPAQVLQNVSVAVPDVVVTAVAANCSDWPL